MNNFAHQKFLKRNRFKDQTKIHFSLASLTCIVEIRRFCFVVLY